MKRARNFTTVRRTSLLWASLFIVLSLFLLGGCGGGGGSSDGGSSSTKTVDAYKGTWVGSGEVSALFSGTEEKGTITFSSLAVSEGTGDTKMILTASGTVNAGDVGSATFSNISIQLKGKVLENGNLEINAVKLDKQGTLKYTDEDGETDTIDLSTSDAEALLPSAFKGVSLDKAPNKALILSSTGFTHAGTVSQDKGQGIGSGDVTGTLSGNTLTLTGKGSGQDSDGAPITGGTGKLTLTRQ